jgi:ATP-dependent DNA helicase RecQ
MRAIANHNPQTLSALNAIPGMGPSKIDRYGAAILAICRNEKLETGNSKLESDRPNQQPPASPRFSNSAQASFSLSIPSAEDQRQRRASSQTGPTAQDSSESKPTRAESPLHPKPQTSAVRQASRPTPTSPPTELTPAQQALDQKLRLWRREQAAAAGLPSFFIVSDTCLRNIVLAQPKTLADLSTIRGLDPEKQARFGPDVLNLCRL